MSIRTNFISFLLTAALAAPAIAQTYTVKSGDSLWKIAEKTKAQNVTVHQMIQRYMKATHLYWVLILQASSQVWN